MLAFVAAMFLSITPLRAQQDSVTDCPLITAHPWYVDFETDYDCWCTVGNYGWSRIYNNSNFGIQGSSSGHSMIASPAVALPADSTGLRFYWTDRQYSGTNTYYVLVSRGERMNLDDYDTLFTSMPGNGSLVQRSVSLADYAGDTVYIAFRQIYQSYRSPSSIFHVAMYNSAVPIGNLEAMADAVAIGDTVRYAVHLTQAADSLLTFSWHSTLLDTTFITTDSTLALVYTVTGSDTLTVTVSNAYGILVQSVHVDVYDCGSVGVIPWEEDFSYDGHVACWIENGFNRHTGSYGIWYEDGSSGSFVNLMWTQTAGSYMLTRPIMVPADADNLALMVEFSGGLDVRVSSTASTDTASYTDHLLHEPYVFNCMKSRWVNLSSYAGQTIRVGLFYASNRLDINRLVLDYDTLPMVIIAGQEKTTTDSATLFVASLRHGSTEGLHYAWHSAAGGTIATNAAGDSAWITYGVAVPGGVDTVRVIATNDYGTDTTYKAIRIVDCTPATTLPWVETFADGIVCWYKPEGSNFISDRPHSYSTDPYFERYRYLKSTCDSDTADHWIVSKAIVVPSDTSQEVVLEWKVGSSNTNFVHTYQVLATSSDDFTDTSLYIPLYFDSSAHGSYLRYDNRAVSLRQFAGQTIHIAFRNRPVNYVGTNVDLLFDDITVRTTCVPVVNLTADNSTYYYGDTATFTATFVEGNPDGLTYTWLSTLLDTTIVGDNTLSLCYGLQDGYDTITVIATNAYGSDTAFVVVTSQIIMQPSVVYFSADGMAFFLEKDHAEVGDTLHYVFVRNRCVTTGLTYSLHSSLLDTTITMAAVGDTCRITLVYTAAGNDSLTAEVANVYGAGTAMRYLAVRDCPAVGVPFCETFDSIETLYNDLLPCWPGWWVLTTSHMVGSSAQSHLHRYLISPAIDLPADTCGLQLSWYTAATTGTTIPVRILVSPTGGKRVEDFTDTLFSRQIVNYTDNSVSLDAYLGQRIRVAFTNYGYMFDNIRVDYDRSVPLVPQPTIEGSATAHLFDDNVYVASLVSGCPQGTTYNWCSSMAAGGLATLTVNGDTAEVRYLALGSDTLRCIATNSFGSDTAVAVVRVIDCSARAVPYYMDFESVTATEWNVLGEIPDCWHSFYDGSEAGYAPHVIDSCPYYGLRDIPDNALIMSGEFPYGSESEVILPCFTDSLQNLLMALDYRYESANIGILTVGYRGADGIFNVVDTLPGYSGSYRRHIVSFADATVPDAQIVLRWQVGGQWAVVIDNIHVFIDNNIPAPTGLTADNLTASCATLRWNAVTDATAYHLILPGIVDTLVADTALSVCGLDEDSDYGFGVYAHVGDEVGHFSGYHPFRTLLYCLPLVSLDANVAGIVRWQYDTTGEALGNGVVLEIADLTSGTTWTDTVWADSTAYPFAIGHRYSINARTLCGNAEAHTTLTIPLQIPASVCAEAAGTSTTTDERFMDNFWSHNYSQIIYPASFAAGIDTLFGIALRVSQFSQPFADTANYNYDIFLGQTDSATLSAPLTSDSLTQVAFNKRFTIRSAGWIEIPFDSVYSCNPTGNLIVTLVERTSNAYSGRHYGVHADATCTHFVQSTDNLYYTNPSTLNFDWEVTTDIPDIRLLGGCNSSLCLAPVAAISAVDTHHVELQWVARGSEGLWQVEYRPSGQTAWTVADTTSANSYTVGGLHAMTTYEFRVASICDGGLQYGSTLTATTPCGEILLPYHIDFRNNEIPCWTIDPDISHSSYYGLYMSSNKQVISPLVVGNIANLYATIKTHGGSSSYYTYNYAVGVCNGDGGNLVWVDTITLSTQYGDHEHTVYFNNYSGMGDHIIIKIISGIIHLREFDLDYVDFCIPAQNVDVTGITDSSAVLQWTANASGHTFAVYLDEVLQTVTSATTYTFTGLAPRTRHLAAVREICGAGDTAAAATRYFRTQCTPTTDLPYFEEFDYSSDLYGDTIGLPPCWDSIGYSHISFSSFSGGALTVMSFYSFEDYTGPYTSYLATPLLNIPSQGARIRFKGQTGHDDVVTAGIMTDPTDASTFIPMATITYNNRGLAWYEFTTEGLDSLNSQFAVAFRWASEGSGSLDSLFVTALPEGYTVTVTANEEGVCETYGSGVYADGSSVVIGYRLLDTLPQGGHWEFLGWSDGASGNPRTLVVISDTAVVALFEWVTDPVTDTMWRTVTVRLVDLATGNTIEESDVVYVEGAGRYMDSTMVTLTAHYADNPLFYGWVTTAGDTISSNPFRFIVTCDTLITAVYAPLPVGIDEVESSKWKVEIFPNPATTEVTILTQAIKQSDNQAITILDLHGRVVYTQAIRYSSNQAITIDISSLPRGVYFVRIGSVVKKLVIQ